MYWIRSFFFLELRALVADFQRDVTSSGVTPGNGVVLEGADSHPSQPVPWDTLWSTSTSGGVLSGSPLGTDHFMLLEIQYTLIFSLSSQHFYNTDRANKMPTTLV